MKPFTLTADWKPPTANQRRGRKAQRVGSNFEKVIVDSALFYHDIIKIEELPRLGARRVGRKNGKPILIPTTIQFDFIGGFHGECGLFFDGKHCGESEVSFNTKTHVHSKPHQLRALQRMAECDQLAGYLIECCALRRYLWLPVEQVVDDGPIRFAREGKLCRQFIDLGETTRHVRFDLLKAAYFTEKP